MRILNSRTMPRDCNRSKGAECQVRDGPGGDLRFEPLIVGGLGCVKWTGVLVRSRGLSRNKPGCSEYGR